MRNNSKLLCIFCALGLLALSCNEDSTTPEPNDPDILPDTCQIPGFVKCDCRCVDPLTSNRYCGANAYCERYEICAYDQICQNGWCIDIPEQPQTCTQDKCGDWCGDLMNDPNHCGNCETQCNPDEYCANGHCESTSSCTQDKCGDWCGDLMNDPNHCGIGGTVIFGNYNGIPIQWYILDHDAVNHRIMLLSMYVLEHKPYHTAEFEAVTWAESTIRSWLNGYGAIENKQSVDYNATFNFMRLAFSSEEKAKIPKVTVVNENNPEYSTPGGNNTQDYVFLLSINEVKSLLPPYISSQDNMCTKIHCAHVWWLRSPGVTNRTAATVRYKGELNTRGDYVETRLVIGVRPALWLNY